MRSNKNELNFNKYRCTERHTVLMFNTNTHERRWVTTKPHYTNTVAGHDHETILVLTSFFVHTSLVFCIKLKSPQALPGDALICQSTRPWIHVIIGFHTVRILLQVVGDRWLILVPVYLTWPFHFCSITWFHCFAWTGGPLLSQLWDWLLLLLRLPVWSFWWSSSHRFLCMRGVCLQMYWHMWFNMSGRGSVLKGHSTYHHSYPWHSNR